MNVASMESIVEEAVKRVQLSMQDTAPEEQNDADELSAAVNLSRVMPDLWQQLPRDIQKIIINARAKEREESSTPKMSTQGESNPGGSDLPRQYAAKPRANLTVQCDANASLME